MGLTFPFKLRDMVSYYPTRLLTEEGIENWHNIMMTTKEEWIVYSVGSSEIQNIFEEFWPTITHIKIKEPYVPHMSMIQVDTVNVHLYGLWVITTMVVSMEKFCSYMSTSMFVPNKEYKSSQRRGFVVEANPPDHSYSDILYVRVSGWYCATKETIEAQTERLT